MGTYNVHGGHSLKCRGASGLLDEVNEDRKVKNKVIELLRNEGHTVYDCTDDVGKTQPQNLSNIVRKCNSHSVNLDVSIHLNSGRNDYAGDDSTGGVEVWNYDSRTAAISDRICQNIANELGLRNRGTKYSKNLYVLNNTKSLAMLVECCFVDDKDDADRWDADKCAKAIAEGILGRSITGTDSAVSPAPTPTPAPAPSTNSGKIDIAHQILAKAKGWLGEVVNYNNNDSNGYSGWLGYPMLAFRAKTKGNASEVGYLEYRAHKKGGGYFGWRRDYEKDSAGDTFAGDGVSEIDGIQMRIVGVSGRHVRYRVHVIGKGWLEWITDYGDGNDGYAGWFGYAIDAVQVEAA